MAKKSVTKQSQQGLGIGIDSLHNGRYELAKQQFEGVIETIEQSNLYGEHNSYYRIHQHYLFVASFGHGFSEGLTERDKSEYKTLNSLADIAKEFHDAANTYKTMPEEHRTIGRGYGVFGLKREGLKILENSWEKPIICCYLDHPERIRDM